MRKPQIIPPPDRHKIGYARVSTPEQNLDMQISALKRYGVDEMHVEKVSTRKSRRAKLEHAISEIRPGDVFVVWRLDRIGRSVDDLLALVGRISAAGADLVSLTETIDMTTPGGKMMFHMFCSFAQFERDIIRERTSKGMQEWIAKGGKPGRKPVLDAKKTKTVLDMLNAGESKWGIAKAVKCSVTTINNYFEFAGRPKAWRQRKRKAK